MNLMQAVRQLICMVTVLCCAPLLQGCLASPFFKNISSMFRAQGSDEKSGDADSNINIIPLRIPQSGESISIRDPRSDRELIVRIGEVYTSASGKLCGRYELDDGKSTAQSGLVCFDDQEEWVKVPLQLPGSF